MADDKTTLQSLRQEIDAIDHDILDLLRNRCSLVMQVGKLKAKEGTDRCFLRPDREAQMLRSLTSKIDDLFPKKAIANIWRMIISTSLNLEQRLSLSSYYDDGQQECYWLAREYFGSFLPHAKTSQEQEILQGIETGDVSIGIFPEPENEESPPWWVSLIECNDIKVFARIPFIQPKENNQPTAFTVARLDPAETGDDTSLVVATMASDDSDDRIKEMESAISDKLTLITGYVSRETFYVLIAIDGFTNEEDPAIKDLAEKLDDEVTFHYIGAFANPILLEK